MAKRKVVILELLAVQRLLAFDYVPFMNPIFHSKPVDTLSWIAAAALALAIYAIVGFEKWLRFGRGHRVSANAGPLKR